MLFGDPFSRAPVPAAGGVLSFFPGVQRAYPGGIFPGSCGSRRDPPALSTAQRRFP